MANIRIKDLSTTASTTASDDFFGVDGATNGTRKLNAYSPTFGGNLTVSGGSIGVGGAIGSYLDILQGGNDAYVYNRRAGQLIFGTNNSTVMQFPSTGNCIVGSPYTDGGQKLQVNGTAQFTGNVNVYKTSGEAALQADYSTTYVKIFNDSATLGLYSNSWGGLLTFTKSTEATTVEGKSIVLKPNGTTALTLASDQSATFAGTAIFGKGGGNTTFSANGTTAESGIFVQANTGFVFFADNATAGKGIKVDVNNGGLTVLSGGITTASAGGSAGTWKLGVANTVSPTSPNRTITIDIGGTTYYLAAKTTND